MILLSKEEIEKLIDPNEMMDQIEEAYRLYGENQFFMPPRPVIEHDNKSLIYMPCYTDDVIGTNDSDDISGEFKAWTSVY